MSKFLTIFFIFLLVGAPSANAASIEVAGWIPWWQDTMGVESASKHIRDLDIIYPFAFEVTSTGKLVDKANLDEDKWKDLMKLSDKRRVDVIPSVMWFDGDQIHNVLSNSKLRKAHIQEIVDMVKKGGYDGVNIDYESKNSETIDYFSDFLKELEDELGRKKLTCTIEARTPEEDLYKVVPSPLLYANDYKAMAKYCDWVEIMAYDQQRADLTLNKSKSGEPYIPVADIDWVEKVIKLALEDIPADKIMLGVPTYGRQWKLTVEPDWFKEYKSVGAINLPDALELADDYKVKPGRNKGGESSYSFFPESSPYKILRGLPVPKGTTPGFEDAARALTFANLAKMPVEVNIVWYSDADAIEEKVDLAKKYKLRGVAIFKIDGEEDEDIWDLF